MAQLTQTAAPAGLGLKKARKAVMPTKTTLNLAIKEKKELRLSRTVPAVLAVLVCAALFGKFAVADRFAAADTAERAVAARRAELTAIEQSCADYDDVQHTYNQYTYTGFDRTIADRLEVMALLEREVYPVGTVRTLSIAGKTVTLTVSDMTLEQLSNLISRLETDPMVANVAISTATYSGYASDEAFGSTNAAALSISLNDAGPAPAAEAEGGDADA